MDNLPIVWLTFASAILNIALSIFLLRKSAQTPEAHKLIETLKTHAERSKARIFSPYQKVQAERDLQAIVEGNE